VRVASTSYETSRTKSADVDTPDNLPRGREQRLFNICIDKKGYRIFIIVTFVATGDSTPGSATCNVAWATTFDLEFRNSGDAKLSFPNVLRTDCSPKAGGFALGPFTEPGEIRFSFSALTAVDNGAWFVDENDNALVSLVSSGTDLMSNSICITTPEITASSAAAAAALLIEVFWLSWRKPGRRTMFKANPDTSFGGPETAATTISHNFAPTESCM
jgi:hypothetical protein